MSFNRYEAFNVQSSYLCTVQELQTVVMSESNVFGELFSESNMERLLGPYWFVPLRTLPAHYWWLAAMSSLLAVLAISLKSAKGPQPQPQETREEDGREEEEEEEEIIDEGELQNLNEEEEATLLRQRLACANQARHKIASSLTPQERVDEKMQVLLLNLTRFSLYRMSTQSLNVILLVAGCARSSWPRSTTC